MRAYFSQFRPRDEALRLNTFSMRDLRERFERILTFDDHHLVARQGGFECESWLASKSSVSLPPLQEGEARPYIHWQLTSTSSWIMEISTKVVGEIGCQEIIFRMFIVSYKRLDVVQWRLLAREKEYYLYDSVKEERVGWKCNWIAGMDRSLIYTSLLLRH